MAIVTEGHELFSGKRYLVIDDFQGMRGMLREMLKSFGAKEIDMASNGGEAIALLDKNRYDVVLCDYNLGAGKNGQQVLEEAKFRNLIGLTTAWIMVSAEKTTEMVMGAAEYTPDDYIVKPVNESTMRGRLTKVLARKEAFHEIEKAMRAKDYNRAITLCDEQLTARSGYASDLLRMKSNLLINTAQYDKAKKLFDQILAQRDVPWAKTGLAKVYYLTKDYDMARQLLSTVVEENRAYLEGYDWLAKTLEEVGELGEAQRVLVRSAELSPNSINRQKSLGEIAHRRGDLDTAEQAFRKTITLGENSVLKTPVAYIGLAKICSEKDNHAEALKVLGDVHKHFDSAETTLHAKVVEGQVYRKAGDMVNARKAAAEVATAMNEAASRMPASITVEAAELILESGDKETASNLLKVVVQNNHESEAILSQVKEVFAKGNLQEEGQKLVEASRREVVETNNKGVQLAREEKLDEAVELLRNAKTMLPNNKRILLNLAYVMILFMKKNGKDDGMVREVRECLDRVVKLDPGEKMCGQFHDLLEGLPG